MADIDYLQRLRDKMADVTGVPDVPEVEVPYAIEEDSPVQEAVIDAESTQINEEATSPYQKTKPELVQDQVEQAAAQTVPGQLAEQKEEEDPTLARYKSLMQDYEKKLAAPKKEYGVMDALPDILAGLYNIDVRAKGGVIPQMKMPGSIAGKKAADKESRKEDLTGLEKLQDMHQKYVALQSKGKMTPYQQAQLDSADKDRALKEKLAKSKSIKEKAEKITEFTKALHKKQAKDFAESQEGLQKTSTAMSKVEEALDAQLNYSKDSILGTGPIATLGGLTRNVSEETEALEAKFKEIDLKNMVSTFSGMSKAVDSDAERKAWKATQASISNDDKTNVQILLGSKSSLLKDKAVAEAKAEYVKANGNLDGFTHPVLEGKVLTMVTPSGEMILVDKDKKDLLKQQGMKDIDQYAGELSGEKPVEEFVTMISPDGQEARVKKDKVKMYLKKGATVKE